MNGGLDPIECGLEYHQRTGLPGNAASANSPPAGLRPDNKGSVVLPLPGRMWRHAPVYSAMLALLCGGFVGGWCAGDRLQAALSARWSSHPDGAPANTRWTYSYVDVPFVEVGDIHCGGIVRLHVEIGNADFGPLCGGPPQPLPPGARTLSVRCETYFPNGMVLRRVSENGGPWQYELSRHC